jgi:hypothetical protein
MDSIKVNKISEENIHEGESPIRIFSDEHFCEVQVDLSCSVSILGFPAVKLHAVAKRNRIGYEERKD